MRALLTCGLALTLAMAGCSGDGDDGTKQADAGATDGAAVDGGGADSGQSDGDTGDTGDAGQTDASGADIDPGTASFKARGSVEQVFVTHAKEGQELVLRDAAGKDIATAKADHLGSHVYRKVPPGKGYRVHSGADYSGPVDVMGVAESQPPQSFYDGQAIEPGTGYLKMRDGTTLAYFATLPGPADKGPYPTIVNYSGYSPGKPGSPVVPKNLESLCAAFPVLCNAPSDPSAMIAAVAGYATVSVNMRGTGCSGGAYDYFETLQRLDGYDIIETVAAQPWVKGHKVGMTGLSYPGISQLFVARMQPPSLAAITPLSVIGNTVTTLVPGGILNNGFALNWINNVYSKAAPYGQGWEKKQVAAGDKVCEENQLLHDQRVNNVDQAKEQKYYDAEIVDPLNPTKWADEIKVPIFLAGSWQDEQTGPYFVTLLDRFTNAASRRFVVYNGVHSDGFAPQVIVEWKAFLDIYVADRKPTPMGMLENLLPEMTKQIFGVAMKFPPFRWKDVKDHAAARKQWESEPEIRAIMENGAGKDAGAPEGAFTLQYDKWPPKQTKATRWYFRPDGSLADLPPEATTATDALASTWKLDPKAGDRGILGKNGKLWSVKPNYVWKAPAKGFEVAFATPPLTADVVTLGTGSVDLWVRSNAADVKDADIEINLSELRPDGKERYVQSGWLRASYRKLTKTSSELWPEPSFLKEDITPIEPGKWHKLRVAIPGFAHVFRKGSRIRIAVDTPGDSRADWRFELLKWSHDVSYDLAHSKEHPSSIALPVIAGAVVPADAKLPPCPSLRGQQCRAFKAKANVPAGGGKK